MMALVVASTALGACSSSDDPPGPTQINDISAVLDPPSSDDPDARPAFFPSDGTVTDAEGTGAVASPTESAASPVEPATPAPITPVETTPSPAPGSAPGGVTLPGLDDLGDALGGRPPESAVPDGDAVLPRLQNSFRSNADYDLWGCNPVDREEALIVYSYLGEFGVLTVPDPVTGSPQNAQAQTYTVTETSPGTVMLSFLGLGRAEEIGQFRFTADGDGYDAFSSTFGTIACGRISAGQAL